MLAKSMQGHTDNAIINNKLHNSVTKENPCFGQARNLLDIRRTFTKNKDMSAQLCSSGSKGQSTTQNFFSTILANADICGTATTTGCCPNAKQMSGGIPESFLNPLELVYPCMPVTIMPLGFLN